MSVDSGPTRGRPSRFDALPPEIRAYIDRRLREGATQAAVRRETAGMLAEAGEAPLSAGGLNRYTQQMERAGRRIRESRAAADAWIAKFGEAPSGNVGRVVIETLRSLIHALSLRLNDEADGAESPIEATLQIVNDLALATQRLERADGLAITGERKLREQVAAEAAKRAAEVAESAARESGHALPAEVLERIRRDVYGIRDAV